MRSRARGPSLALALITALWWNFASGHGILTIEWYDQEVRDRDAFNSFREILSTFRKLTDSKTYSNTKYGYRFSYPDGNRIAEDSPELVFVRPEGSSSAPLPTVKVARQTASEYVDSLLSEDSKNRKVVDQTITVNGRSARRVVIATSVGLNFEHTVLERDGYVIDVLGLDNDAIVVAIRDSLSM